MKKRHLFLAFAFAAGISTFNNLSLSGQTVSDFESLNLPYDSLWNGSDFSGGFADGHVFYINTYHFDSIYGGYWSGGFAYSSMHDTVTGDFTNLYSSIAGTGCSGSMTYGVGQNYAWLKLTGVAAGKQVNGFYVTNATYPAISMKNGDAFAKKFGGTSGNDPDWFRLSITGFKSGNPLSDTVHFYLADFRFQDNSDDYILNTWQWVDLTSLGNADSLQFLLSSSDVGQFGMNTPPFFCLDNFTTADSPAGISPRTSGGNLALYPNPANGYICFQNPIFAGLPVEIFNSSGSMVFKSTAVDFVNKIDISAFIPGIYLIKMGGYQSVFIKQQ